MQGAEIIAQADARPDLPTWAWIPGETRRTQYTLTLPPDAAPDAIFAGMYTQPLFLRAPVTQNGDPAPDDRALITRFPVD